MCFARYAAIQITEYILAQVTYCIKPANLPAETVNAINKHLYKSDDLL